MLHRDGLQCDHGYELTAASFHRYSLNYLLDGERQTNDQSFSWDCHVLSLRWVTFFFDGQKMTILDHLKFLPI